MGDRWGNSGNSVRLYFSGLQNHCRWWLHLWNEKMLALGRKTMTNLDSILKNRDITLPTKVRLVKDMIFPVVMYRCESWTMKKAECQWTDAFELWCWRRLLRVLWTARRSNQSILKEISPEYSLEGLMLWSWNSNTLAMWCKELTQWRRPWFWERLKEGEGDHRGWDGWMASLTWWTWVWVGDGQGSLACCSPWGHKVGHDWVTVLNWSMWQNPKDSFLLKLEGNCSWFVPVHTFVYG